MKNLFVLILCIVLIAGSSAIAENDYPLEYGSLGEFVLEPGRYEIGIDIPEGYYDVRIKGLNESCTIRFSLGTNLDDSLNMTDYNSYELTFKSAVNYWQGCHPNIFLWGYGFLEIEDSACTFYPIEKENY